MLSERESAKYPFLKTGLNLIESLNLQLNELAEPNFTKVLDRASERVIEAILKSEVSIKLTDPLTELISFPIAIMYVSLLGENYLNRRYALAEAVRAYQILQDEHEDKIIQIAKDEFNWDIKREPENLDGNIYTIKLAFPKYLQLTKGFHEPIWKLVNRHLSEGYVSLKSTEVARLIQVEVENFIKERVSKPSRFTLPIPLKKRFNKIKKVFEENRGNLIDMGLPDQMIKEAFPPCMKYCLEGLLSGRRASHMERFGLTSFLVNVGMPIDDMVQLYTSVTDFDASLTRYQIEHIAGLKGNRTKYIPPTCSTLRTHGICRNMDSFCKRVNHPLNYYRIKTRHLERNQEDGQLLNKSSPNTEEQE